MNYNGNTMGSWSDVGIVMACLGRGVIAGGAANAGKARGYRIVQGGIQVVGKPPTLWLNAGQAGGLQRGLKTIGVL